MIKNIVEQQIASKHPIFAEQLAKRLRQLGIPAKPVALASAFNIFYKTTSAKPHTVRKWLLGQTQPKSETLLLLARWLNVEPSELISKPTTEITTANKISFEFDFTDQEVIANYLSMTVKQKLTVRLLIDAISDKTR